MPKPVTGAFFIFAYCVFFMAANLPNVAAPDIPSYMNSLGMKMVRISPGSFLMGNTDPIPPLPRDERLTEGDFDQRGDWDERPVHKVTISNAFFCRRLKLLGSNTEISIRVSRGVANSALTFRE